MNLCDPFVMHRIFSAYQQAEIQGVGKLMGVGSEYIGFVLYEYIWVITTLNPPHT